MISIAKKYKYIVEPQIVVGFGAGKDCHSKIKDKQMNVESPQTNVEDP